MKNNSRHKFEHTLIDLSVPSLEIDRKKPYLVDRLILSGDSANVVLSAYALPPGRAETGDRRH